MPHVLTARRMEEWNKSFLDRFVSSEEKWITDT